MACKERIPHGRRLLQGRGEGSGGLGGKEDKGQDDRKGDESHRGTEISGNTAERHAQGRAGFLAAEKQRQGDQVARGQDLGHRLPQRRGARRRHLRSLPRLRLVQSHPPRRVPDMPKDGSRCSTSPQPLQSRAPPRTVGMHSHPSDTSRAQVPPAAHLHALRQRWSPCAARSLAAGRTLRAP